MAGIKKILVANRGEIAVRIIRTANRIGIKTVVLFADNDKDASHVGMADESFLLSGVKLNDTYLNIKKIVDLAVRSGSDAIHPGYGFLSENPDFAKACKKNKILFIGPSPESIGLMGNKIKSRSFVERIGVPVLKVVTGDREKLLTQSKQIDFPLLIKAAAGGGGKGMRIVYSYDELDKTIQATTREAKSYFGDEEVYLEKYIRNPRHIEVQILGDQYGNVIHVFERECSVQRRYQKIIEETPASNIPEKIREKIHHDAVTITKSMHYHNAGTVEFLVDKDFNHFFLEMNTRLQVEHPVTEMTTGLDLVEEQIRIASGEKLRFNQDKLKQSGHALECRIYAEDPDRHFLPAPGRVTFYHEPVGENIRVDSGIKKPGFIHSSYDPMICKLIVKGKNRKEAINRMNSALSSFFIHGVKQNISFLRTLVNLEVFRKNSISTDYCEEHLQDLLTIGQKEKAGIDQSLPLLIFLIYSLFSFREGKVNNIWERLGYWRFIMKFSITSETGEVEVILHRRSELNFVVTIFDQKKEIKLVDIKGHQIKIKIEDQPFNAFVSIGKNGTGWISYQGQTFQYKRHDFLSEDQVYTDEYHESVAHDGKIISPMPGKIVDVVIEKGSFIKKGEVLLVVESMKMENNLVAPFDGIVQSMFVKESQMISNKQVLAEIKQKSTEES